MRATEETIDELQGIFYDFLRETKAYPFYWENTPIGRKQDWFLDQPVETWIDHAFSYSESPEGTHYWTDLSVMWREHLEERTQ